MPADAAGAAEAWLARLGVEDRADTKVQVVTGDVDELLTRGPWRLAVRVEASRDATWARVIPGVTVSEVQRGAVRLMLEQSVDSDSLLRAAMAAGRVTQFTFERRG